MTTLSILQYGLIGLAAFAAGFVNALAGGGTLITFPLMTFLGIPPITANVTNTVALCPGYFGATMAQRGLLIDQEKRFWLFIPSALIGGLIGGFLLLKTGERLFTGLIPYLILLASLLLAVGEPIRKWLENRSGAVQKSRFKIVFAGFSILVAAVYGGYFGAGLSVILLAVLALFVKDSITRLNALKQALALSTNVAAAIFFIFSGKVMWVLAAVMAAFALAGGALGGKVAGVINPVILRWIIVFIGIAVAVVYFFH